MIRYITGQDLLKYPFLGRSMFRDRALQFSKRLRWTVDVDSDGLERDCYDLENPTYIIVLGGYDDHIGSVRLLPTSGRTMINDHFQNSLAGEVFDTPSTWECTRFCVAPGAPHTTSLRLLAAIAVAMPLTNVSSVVAIFDEKMLKLYGRLGVSPRIIGRQRTAEGQVFSGEWIFSRATQSKLLKLSGLNRAQVQNEFQNARSNVLRSLESRDCSHSASYQLRLSA